VAPTRAAIAVPTSIYKSSPLELELGAVHSLTLPIYIPPSSLDGGAPVLEAMNAHDARDTSEAPPLVAAPVAAVVSSAPGAPTIFPPVFVPTPVAVATSSTAASIYVSDHDSVPDVAMDEPATIALAVKPMALELRSPLYLLPPSLPRGVIAYSIIEQMDGLLHCLFGVRLEHDVMAPSADLSFTKRFGLQPYECLAEAVCLFFSRLESMPQIVAVAAAHRACGIFIIPEMSTNTDFESLEFKFMKRVQPWRMHLELASKKIFRIPADAFEPRLPVPVIGVWANFGMNVRFKRKKIPERQRGFLNLLVQKRHHGRKHLPVVPSLLHRVSPVAEDLCPTMADDVAPTSEPFLSCPPDSGVLKPRDSPWATNAFEEVCCDFPLPSTKSLAISVMRGDLDPFCGDRSKTVALPALQHSPRHYRLLRDKFMSEVSRGLQAGPFPVPPVPNARPINVIAVPKHKYVPAGAPGSDDIRVAHDLSESPVGDGRRRGRQSSSYGSINSLCYTPRFLSTYFSFGMLADTLAEIGHGVSLSWADVPKAFKRNPTNPELFFLAVTQLASPEATEYFVELANTFGWTVSEWGWQAELALILWWLEKRQVDHTYAFVDNFFQVHSPGTTVLRRAARTATLQANFAEMGIELHEEGSGTFVEKALGWTLDLDRKRHPRGWRMIMICPECKFHAYRVKFEAWMTAPMMSLRDLASAAGIVQFLSAAFPTGAAYVAPLISLRDREENSNVVAGEQARPGKRVMQRLVKVTQQVREAIRFFHAVLITWDRTAPLLCRFGPTAGAQIHGWVDAATLKTDGCGGIFFDPVKRVLQGFFRPWTEDERAYAASHDGAKRVSTGVLESAALMQWLAIFQTQCQLKRVLLRTDSSATMQAFNKAFSSKPAMLRWLRAARLLVGRNHFILRVRHVGGSVFNVIADLLSHGRSAEACRVALELFGLRLVLVPVVAMEC
jgi:hypothetical protein